MLFGEVIAAIEEVADPRYQAPWDNSGLQIASGRKQVRKLAVFLDPTPQNMKKALDLGADCALSHHPLALKPQGPNKLNSYFKVLKMALAADAPLYAAHTSLDVNPKGPAGWLGDALGVVNRQILEKLPDVNLGYGEVGDLPAPLAAGEFIGEILKLLNLREAFLCGPDLPAKISRVAWCGGSGASLIEAAAHAGADAYLTGDIKYHAALEADIAALDVGHHGIEEEMTRKFAAYLAGRLPGLEVVFVPSASPFRLVN